MAPRRHEVMHAPEGFDCRAANGLGDKPTVASTEGALTPPDDGFFDPRATFRGAFRDREDD